MYHGFVIKDALKKYRFFFAASLNVYLFYLYLMLAVNGQFVFGLAGVFIVTLYISRQLLPAPPIEIF